MQILTFLACSHLKLIWKAVFPQANIPYSKQHCLVVVVSWGKFFKA